MAGMFKKTTTEVKTEPKKKGKEKIQLKIAGLHQLTLLDALIKQASAMQATLKSEINAVGFEKFVSLSGQAERPSSFEGIDGHSTASVEVRKRSSGSVLTDEEVEILTEAGIEAQTKIIQPHLFAINPKYAANEALLGKVEKALSKIVPEDFISQQQEVSRKVVSDEMLDNAFRGKASEQILAILTTMALKPKLSESYDMNNLIKDALEVMQPTKKTAKPAKPALKSVK
jgi:hypothetical protein